MKAAAEGRSQDPLATVLEMPGRAGSKAFDVRYDVSFEHHAASCLEFWHTSFVFGSSFQLAMPVLPLRRLPLARARNPLESRMHDLDCCLALYWQEIGACETTSFRVFTVNAFLFF